MSTKEEKVASGRRDFLKLAAVAAPAAAAGVTLGGTEAAADTAMAGGAGLRDTEHTRAYFESARF
ncbi:twin-arginine translocation pathway signal protein [Halovulum dunhuangense]|uniref:Twin-arginine translocation pathway signal protein n=1 Tax=Halovulum dunhuangense TaxID=1505036 RepID=A0A849L2C6_9RHOB|nr:twin-arginine translocation pathway signal protein [Halovulum dunhuangense]NNU80382.1 twin-arginine translocation pathway signal protein [Halovulum dunhuangense]